MKKGDWLLIISILALTLILFLPSNSSSDNLQATIYLDGEIFQTINLSDVEQSYELNVGQCVLLIESDGVSFISSTCSDKLCVNSSKLKTNSSAMACIPNNVVVEILEDSSSFDAVAY